VGERLHVSTNDNLSFDFDDIMMESDGLSPEVRDQRQQETIQELLDVYGGQILTYGSHSGTISDVIESCPYIRSLVDEGASAVINAIESHKDDPNAVKLDDEQQEIQALDDISMQPEISTSADTSQKEIVDDSRVDEQSIDDVELNASVNNIAEEKQRALTPVAEVTAVKQYETVSDNVVTVDTVDETKEIQEDPKKTDIENETVSPQLQPESDISIVVMATPIQKEVLNTPEIITEDQLELKDLRNDTAEKLTVVEYQSDDTSDSQHEVKPTEGNSEVAVLIPQDAAKIDVAELSIIQNISQIDEIAKAEPQSEMPFEPSESEFTFVNELSIESSEDDPNDSLTDNILDHSSHDSIQAYEEEASIDFFEVEGELSVDSIDESLKTEAYDERDDFDGKVESTYDTQFKDLPDEVIDIAEELFGEFPEEEVAYEPAGLQSQIERVIESIEILSRATSAEECHDSLRELRLTLIELLYNLGYHRPEILADQLIKKYDMKQLHAILMRLQQAAASHHNALLQNFTSVEYPHYTLGRHVVGMFVSMRNAIRATEDVYLQAA
jgi:hypothetical protein